MQPLVYEFVEKHKKEKNITGKVLDVGSLDVNGCLKPLFVDCEYTGVDILEGENVDIIANAQNIPFDNDTFDCVTCVEMFEHDSAFWVSILEIKRVLKSNGWLILCASGIGMHKHNEPDYWRFTKEAFEILLDDLEQVETVEEVDEVLAIGQKT